MDIKEIRQGNLKLLMQIEGGRNSVAARIDTAPGYLSQISSGGRGMGDSLARRIETAFEKEKGWMDSPHSPEVVIVDGAHRGEPRLSLDNVDYLEKAIFEVELICIEESMSLTPHMKAAAITNVYSAAVKSDWALTESWANATADSLRGTLQAI